jgi:hypothetical protein
MAVRRGIAPVAIGIFEHVIIGGGPIIGYRSAGKRQSDIGAIVLSGASIPLRKGLALNLAAPINGRRLGSWFRSKRICFSTMFQSWGSCLD